MNKTMEPEIYCLGIERLGECLYNPADPTVYFALGHLISVIALLLAFSQLTRPIIQFRLKVHILNYKYKIIIVLSALVLAILSVFVATILPFIPGTALPLVGYPVFWELLSASLFIGISIYVVSVIAKPAKFTSKDAKSYLNATVSFIAKGGEERLNELAEEIYPSISGVIEEVKQFNQLQEEKSKTHKHSESVVIPDECKILDAWTDKLFCKAMVCRHPDSAVEIIRQLAKNPIQRIGYTLNNEIINQSFENSDSILIREEKYSGLGVFKRFTRQCFGDPRFVGGFHKPLESWEWYKNTVKDWQVAKYCECTKIAFEAYIESKSDNQDFSPLSVAVDTMADIATGPILSIKYFLEQDIYGSENQKILFKISDGYQEIIKTVLNGSDYPECGFDEKNYDSLKDPSIFNVVAKGIYQYFEALTKARRHDDFIENCANEIWKDIFEIWKDIFEIWEVIFDVSSSEVSKNQDEIGKRLLFHIKQKINENFDHEQHEHPAITKLLLSLIGIDKVKSDENQPVADFRSYFLDMIKAKFPLLYKRDKEFALNMLPKGIIYDEVNNILIDKRNRRRGTTALHLNKISK